MPRRGIRDYQDFYYLFDNRDMPDMFEETMPEIFPETAPGNFTWDPTLGKWVMTVFNSYQWDLNYTNPRVLIEMVDIILFWANQGADIVRLDAVAFLWKKIGTACQNEREAHLILQLMKDCCQVVAPGVLFIAEAIVAPLEIIKYFGEDAVIAKECEIAYNATFMALLWNSIATKSAEAPRPRASRACRTSSIEPPGSTTSAATTISVWASTTRISAPSATSRRPIAGSSSTGSPGVSRTPRPAVSRSGSTRRRAMRASPARWPPWWDWRLRSRRTTRMRSISRSSSILLLHGMIMSYGGIPLLYYGDEIGTLNDCTFLEDESKAGDTRWLHRPRIDWEKAERRHEHGSVEQRIFDGLKKMISVRKTIPAFADFNNRELLDVDNPHLFAFLRTHPALSSDAVLVVANFDVKPSYLDLANLGNRGLFQHGQPYDLYSGETPGLFNDRLVVPPCRFYWLTDQRPMAGF